jgi:hypothetical protein
LIRQRATGADSPSSSEIHLPNAVPDFYDRLVFAPATLLTIENVLESMKCCFATDAAGNVGEHILDLPVDVQNAAPRGKIQGFRPR